MTADLNLDDVTSASVRTRILAGLPAIGRAEQAVAKALLDNSDQVPTMSVQAVADLASTSRATVVRTCQALGFSGYLQLRTLVARDNTLADVHPVPAVPQTFADLIHAHAESLKNCGDLISEAQVDAVIELIASAPTVLVVAGGLSGPIADSLNARMLRLGIHTLRPTDPMEQQLHAAALGAHDLVIAVSGSGTHHTTVQAARRAHRAGAHVVALTGHTGTALERWADITLISAARIPAYEDEQQVPSRLSQHLVAEVLVLALQNRLGRPASEKLAQSLEVASDYVDE